MSKLDAQYRLTRPITNSEFFADDNLSYTARGIVVTMSHREASRDGGRSTSLRSLIAESPGTDDSAELADALAELVNAGIVTQIFQ